MSVTVAVTGPTGDIGRAFMRALERSREVGAIRAMARRELDPVAEGWRKTTYLQGDVLDRDAVDELVAGADAVVHLAFAIMGAGGDDGRRVNLEGSRNVFAATVRAGVPRLVYTSSVAAYGFHPDNPSPLTEDVPPRGTGAHAYSAGKAEVEQLLGDVTRGSATAVYVFRPCIVAGPDALMMIASIPYVQLSERVPETVRWLLDTAAPVLKPVIPDNGTRFQLVHHDDVASALRAAALGRGEPGVYNLAGPGELTMRDLAEDLGWYAVPVPDLAVDAAAELARLPFVPEKAQWVNALRVPVVMDTAKARRALRWRPRHGARETLRETIAQARAAELLR
ncbi:MAG TPA: NAD-dependent epimerase/dehydratase family protein [Conexibacter sp.]